MLGRIRRFIGVFAVDGGKDCTPNPGTSHLAGSSGRAPSSEEVEVGFAVGEHPVPAGRLQEHRGESPGFSLANGVDVGWWHSLPSGNEVAASVDSDSGSAESCARPEGAVNKRGVDVPVEGGRVYMAFGRDKPL